MTSEGPARFGVEELRSRLERIDRTIVELLSVRVALSATIIRERWLQGRAVTDRPQERTVHTRARNWSRELGLPPELADRLLKALVAAGKERFREQTASAPDSGSRSSRGPASAFGWCGEGGPTSGSDSLPVTGISGSETAVSRSSTADAFGAELRPGSPSPIERRRPADP